MFTGIITDIGEVKEVKDNGADKSFKIKTSFDLDSIDLGASICCSGTCLTVTEKDEDSFSVDVSAESLSRTNLGNWSKGTEINLERSLKMGDEMGGHNVSGHVDGLVEVSEIEQVGESWKFTFIAPATLACYTAEKGSVTLDGVSLTVNDVTDHSFDVNIIPHTFENTTFKNLKVGSEVNMEIDVIARYTARLLENRN